MAAILEGYSEALLRYGFARADPDAYSTLITELAHVQIHRAIWLDVCLEDDHRPPYPGPEFPGDDHATGAEFSETGPDGVGAILPTRRGYPHVAAVTS
jgi:hypothetical protein